MYINTYTPTYIHLSFHKIINNYHKNIYSFFKGVSSRDNHDISDNITKKKEKKSNLPNPPEKMSGDLNSYNGRILLYECYRILEMDSTKA
jgi:hypothetical protein